jgi:O-antigen ligase
VLCVLLLTVMASYQARFSKFAGSDWGACLVFALPAWALTTRFGLVLLQFCILLTLFSPAVRAWYGQHFRTIAFICMAFAGYFLVSMLRWLIFGQDLRTLDGPSRLLYGLACIGFVACWKPSKRWFYLGICIGVIGACLLALVQRFALQMARVDGYTHHPITFGDLALAMGLLAMCTVAQFRGTRLAFLPWLALLAGMLVSVLSGSRGGWLALPLVLWPLLRHGRPVFGKVLWWGLLLGVCVALLAWLVPATGVAVRIAEAVSDVKGYLDHQDATTSVGIRLELWKASLLMFADHPWFGVGRDQFDTALEALAAQGRIQDSPALEYSSSHNDILHCLATGGILDLTCLLMMYGAPWWFFSRILQTAQSHAQAVPALMGLVLVTCLFAFGLTDVMFWLMMPKVFYVMMVSVLIGFCLGIKDLHD